MLSGHTVRSIVREFARGGRSATATDALKEAPDLQQIRYDLPPALSSGDTGSKQHRTCQNLAEQVKEDEKYGNR
jgi:hypothetical protein